MKSRLYRDWHQHIDGKVIKHRAGDVVDLPPDVAHHVNTAIVRKRERNRKAAAGLKFTPEAKRK